MFRKEPREKTEQMKRKEDEGQKNVYLFPVVYKAYFC
jgi:hypothetical protein